MTGGTPMTRRITDHAVQLLGSDSYRTPEWYEARRERVSASEIAAILGLSPYVSPFDLWWQKRTGSDSQSESKGMRRGRRHEPMIIEDFEEEHPEFRVLPSGLIVNNARPWQVCTPDGLVYEEAGDHEGPFVEPVAVIECKTDGDRSAWGEEGTDEIPVQYRCQVLWQLDTLGLNVAYVPVWFGVEYKEFVVEYHEADVLLMREAAEQFLADVREDRQPDIDAHTATRRRLKHLHPKLTDETAEIPATLVRQYQRAKRLRDAAQERMNLAENRVRALIGSAAKAEFIDGAGKRRSMSHSIYEVAEHVRKASTTDRINFPRKEIP